VSDAGVGALAARSAVLGAHLNVKINAAGLADKAKVECILDAADKLSHEAQAAEAEILSIVNRKIEKA
jgi:glutamate formiminotransferase/formiminotetrahydrofolate cyclodeaminase